MQRAIVALLLATASTAGYAQSIDRSEAPNPANAGIAKSLAQEIGAGRGDWSTPDSSSFIIARDPFRAIRRGRQIFQRKFRLVDGQGSLAMTGHGDVTANPAIGAGMADSCAACHGRPRGAAGSGGDVATRPDSRDAPHLFGLGIKEMLADEMTSDLRAQRSSALAAALATHSPVSVGLVAKGVGFGRLTVKGDGTIDTSMVQGVDPDLRIRPFGRGGKISIREFVIGALNDEMGLQTVDPYLAAAQAGARMVTPSGMVLDGSLDRLEGPPAASATDDPDGDGVADEIPVSLVDYLEFYLLNYFRPATYRTTASVERGRAQFARIGCAQCHVPNLTIRHDRRVADVDTSYDPVRGHFNHLFATVSARFQATSDATAFPALKQPKGEPFEVRGIYTDFKRHDVGPGFYERNYDGTLRREFMTAPLWGVGSTAPYGHDGRSVNLAEVILRHGGEAQAARDAFAQLGERGQSSILAFLGSLVLFPPDDTASNLDPGDPSAPGFPQFGHGSISLSVLYDDPKDPE